MDWKERDDGWFTWFECPNCGAREFSRKPVCACCHIHLGKDEPPCGEKKNGTAKDVANETGDGINYETQYPDVKLDYPAEKYGTVQEIVEAVVKKIGARIKTKKGTKRMKQENIYMLQYVAGALHGICTMMSDTDEELKNVLSSLSEEVSNVVISETIDKEEETKSKVSIYMDDGGDDGK